MTEHTRLSVCHPGVFTKLNKMVFISQTHLFFIVLNVLLGPNSTLSTIIKRRVWLIKTILLRTH
jgi:hypothetical protein